MNYSLIKTFDLLFLCRLITSQEGLSVMSKMIKMIKRSVIGLVLMGMLAQPCQGTPAWMNKNTAGHALNGLLTMGTAFAASIGGWNWYASYRDPLEKQKIEKQAQKNEIQKHFKGNSDDKLKIHGLKGEIVKIDNELTSNDSSYKVKTALYAGVAATGIAYLVNTFRKSISKQLVSKVGPSFEPSQKSLWGRALDAASFGVAASSGVYATTNVMVNDFAHGKTWFGIAKLFGLAAAVIGMKYFAHKLHRSAAQENVVSILRNWTSIAKENAFSDVTLNGMSTRVNAGTTLTDDELNTAQEKLKALGFNEEMDGLVINQQ